jgi:hypothetical protein
MLSAYSFDRPNPRARLAANPTVPAVRLRLAGHALAVEPEETCLSGTSGLLAYRIKHPSRLNEVSHPDVVTG